MPGQGDEDEETLQQLFQRMLQEGGETESHETSTPVDDFAPKKDDHPVIANIRESVHMVDTKILVSQRLAFKAPSGLVAVNAGLYFPSQKIVRTSDSVINKGPVRVVHVGLVDINSNRKPKIQITDRNHDAHDLVEKVEQMLRSVQDSILSVA